MIGLSAAWYAAREGLEVVVVDPSPGSGASWAAAGMLAPVTEVHYNEEALLELNLRAAEAWPAFAAEIEAASDLEVGYRPCGTLAVAADAGDKAVLEDLHRFQVELGLASTWCGPADCRRLEPLLSPRIRGGILVPGDHQADPRRLVRALAKACQRAGVTLVDDHVDRVLTDADRVRGRGVLGRIRDPLPASRACGRRPDVGYRRPPTRGDPAGPAGEGPDPAAALPAGAPAPGAQCPRDRPGQLALPRSPARRGAGLRRHGRRAR